MDNLQKIFHSQRELNNKLVPGFDDITSSDDAKVAWLQRFHLATQQEMAEMIDSIAWKWWKHSDEKIDMQNLKVELIDILFFWVSMCQVAGFDAKEMTAAYFQKLKINHERADKGYAKGTYSKVDEFGNEDNRRVE